jgi:amidohydrolase
MDALPIQEENDQPYRSQNDGVMHACGHDGHMAILLGAAKVLCKHRGDLKGAVKFVFQPGEEGFAGARYMIEDGVMENPSVDAAFGLHMSSYLPVGMVSVRAGAMMASMDSFNLTIKGKGGHAASPQEGADAVLISAHVVSALQSLISKEVPPTSPLVVHIGTIHGGNAFNIIAESVRLEGTVRAHDEDLRKSMPERMDRICQGITTGLRGSHELDYQFGYPALVNDAAMTGFFQKVAKEILSEDKVVDLPPIMASDDMAFFLEKAPGCYFFLGGANHEKGLNKPSHNSLFDFDEGALAVGAEVMTTLALKYLESP